MPLLYHLLYTHILFANMLFFPFNSRSSFRFDSFCFSLFCVQTRMNMLHLRLYTYRHVQCIEFQIGNYVYTFPHSPPSVAGVAISAVVVVCVFFLFILLVLLHFYDRKNCFRYTEKKARNSNFKKKIGNSRLHLVEWPNRRGGSVIL